MQPTNDSVGAGDPADPSENGRPDTSAQRNPEAPDPDPTRVLNQAALRRSTGTIWLVMGALFLLASLLSFGVVIAAGSGASTPLAITGGVVAIALYGAMVLVRLTVAGGPKRLRLLAACMLTMALVSLLGVWVCAFIEASVLDAGIT